MTLASLVDARAAIITALQGAGLSATDTPGGSQPPYVYVAAEGGDTRRLLAGLVQADFRLTCVGGLWDAGAAARQLDVLKQVSLATMRALDGFQVSAVGRDGGRDWAGATYLQADINVSCLVTV